MYNKEEIGGEKDKAGYFPMGRQIYLCVDTLSRV